MICRHKDGYLWDVSRILEELRQNYWKHIVFILLFQISASFCRILISSNDGVSPIWFPFGIAIAFMVRFGPQYAFTMLLSEIAFGYIFFSLPPVFNECFSAGNTATAFLGYLFLKKFGKVDTQITRPTEVFVLIFLTAFVGSLASATTGIFSLFGMGAVQPSDILPAFIIWWKADMIGTIIFTPLALNALNRSNEPPVSHSLYERPLLILATILTLILAVKIETDHKAVDLALAYLFFPVIIWAAARFELLMTSSINAVIALSMIVATVNGLGAFARYDPHEGIILLHAFNLALATTALFVATNTIQKRKVSLALENSNLELEQRVHQRTRELEAARKEAERANEAKSTFLATMTHEIRTPLNGVIGLADLLQKTELNREQREYVEMLRSSGIGLAQIVGETLDFSKAEAGKMTLEPHEFSINSLVREMSAFFGTNAKMKGLELKVSVAEGMPDCLIADATRLRQVIINLIGNALKFTSEGEIRVNISGEYPSEVESELPWFLRIAVADDGVGMSPEEQERIFSPFAQANATTTRKYGGTGLGLAISQQITELMGGRIWVESEPNKGTTFTFEVEVKNGRPKQEESLEARDESTDQAASQDKKQSESNTTKGAPSKVLIVEDNKVNQKITKMLLKRMGYESIIAENGLEAYETFLSESPSTILMDLQMPVMDGFQSAIKIRDYEKESSTDRPCYIIALTANALEAHRKHADAIGMNDFLTKPLLEDVLKAALDKAESTLQKA